TWSPKGTWPVARSFSGAWPCRLHPAGPIFDSAPCLRNSKSDQFFLIEESQSMSFRFGNTLLNDDNRDLIDAASGDKIGSLTETEWRILRCLLQYAVDKKGPVPYQILYAAGWGPDTHVEQPRNLHVQIDKIRKKIGDKCIPQAGKNETYE